MSESQLIMFYTDYVRDAIRQQCLSCTRIRWHDLIRFRSGLSSNVCEMMEADQVAKNNHAIKTLFLVTHGVQF